MSCHEGVSCDSCEKTNYRGKRYKCLLCFDYDLCSTCFDSGATSSRHNSEHPMQCILTRSDFEIFYGGEAITSDIPQSFTCPFCGKMGFTETTLQEHVTTEHADASTDVICPICASLPGGDPNHLTDDFSTHLTLDHRSSRDLDEQQSSNRGRRAPHPTRGMTSNRARRNNMHFNSSALSSISPGARESMDPIAELLSQLSGVRRAANFGQSHSSQLQQLQMQLQLERSSTAATTTTIRQSFDRVAGLNRRLYPNQNTTLSASNGLGQQIMPHEVSLEPSPSPSSLAVAAAAVAQVNNSTVNHLTNNITHCQFLLSAYSEPNLTDAEQQAIDILKADRSLFVQELLISTLNDNLNINDDNKPTLHTRLNVSKESLNDNEMDRKCVVGEIIKENDENKSVNASNKQLNNCIDARETIDDTLNNSCSSNNDVNNEISLISTVVMNNLYENGISSNSTTPNTTVTTNSNKTKGRNINNNNSNPKTSVENNRIRIRAENVPSTSQRQHHRKVFKHPNENSH